MRAGGAPPAQKKKINKGGCTLVLFAVILLHRVTLCCLPETLMMWYPVMKDPSLSQHAKTYDSRQMLLRQRFSRLQEDRMHIHRVQMLMNMHIYSARHS